MNTSAAILEAKQGDAVGATIPSRIDLPSRRRLIRQEPIPKPGIPPQFPDYLRPIPINTRSTEAVLRSYLASETPELRRILVSTWTAQADALKFEEIRNAVRDGELSHARLIAWQEQYATMVNEELVPKWRAGMSSGARALSPGLAKLIGEQPVFNEAAERIGDWIEQNGARLIQQLSTSQQTATRNILQELVVKRGAGVREVDQALRAVVGLTPQQASAYQAFSASLGEQVGEGLLDQTQARHVAENFRNRLWRIRSRRIAQTEIAAAHNYGQLEQVRQLIDGGLISVPVVKRFSTSKDERVCPWCAPLDGVMIGMNETWPGATQALPNVLAPPIHPFCRCTLVYEVLLDPVSIGKQ